MLLKNQKLAKSNIHNSACSVNLLDFAINFGPKARVPLADKYSYTRFCLGK